MKRVFLISALFCALFFLAACGGSSKSENETVKLGAPCSIDGEETCSVNGGEILICREQIWHTRDTCNLNFGEHCQKLPSGLYSCTAPKQENEKEKDSDDTDSGQKNDDDADSADDSDSDSGKKQGELYGECYPNKTCNEGLDCDAENNICIKSGGNDNDDTDSGSDDDTDTGPDEDQILEEKCNEAGGTWNSENRSCTKTENCDVKPANTVWNDGKEGDETGKFTQTWTGTNWDPADYASEYGEETGICRYKCADTHYRYNSECLNPCDNNPCKTDGNAAPDSCVASSWQDYSCGCKEGYLWHQMQCKKQFSLGNICTGQILCYNNSGQITCPASTGNNFYGQDPQHTDKCTPQSFTTGTGTLEGTVFDNNTLLTWEQSPSTDRYIWENAHEHCDDLNNLNDGEGFAGIKTWRLPNPLEILSIADNRTYQPSVNVYFTGIPSGQSDFLWTSKDYQYQTSSMARAFNPFSGWLEYGITKTKECQVLCVSGVEMLPATTEDFVTSDDGKTVTDKKTGLMWQSGDSGSSMGWQQALAYCDSLNTGTEPYAGYTDWRLPNKNEFASLLDHGKILPYFSNFPGLPSNTNTDYWLWSSSTVPSSIKSGWAAHFNHGSIYYVAKNATYRARCVRNAE